MVDLMFARCTAFHSVGCACSSRVPSAALAALTSMVMSMLTSRRTWRKRSVSSLLRLVCLL